jgi:hypothetical protein
MAPVVGEGVLTHPELIAAKRAISLGRLTAFGGECWRLARLVQAGVIAVHDAVDALEEANVANDVSVTHGTDLVQGIMSDAFAAGVYGVESPPGVEVAA